MATMTSANPMSDLMYDWVTVLHNKAEGVNPMYMLYHVLDPDRFLNRTVKYVRWLWTPPAVAFFGVLFLLTIGVFAEHFGTIWQETLETYAFLKKPFELEELLATIERLIGKGEPRNGAP